MTLHPIIQHDIDYILTIAKAHLGELSGKKILITGANGMLARYLVYTLLQANETVLKKPAELHLLTRSTTKTYGANPHIHYLAHDIAQSKLPLKSITHVIHAASKSAPKEFTKNMIDTLDTNIRGTYNLIDSLDTSLESFLFFSSGAIYGEDTPEGKSFDESYVGRVDHLSPKAAYTMGKIAAESILMTYFRERGLPVKIARIFHTFGPGLNLSDGRVFSDFISDALAGRDILLKGDPQVVRPYLYIADATIMFIMLLATGRSGRAYNIANPDSQLTIEEFAGVVARVANQVRNTHIKVGQKIDEKIEYYGRISRSYRPSTAAFERHFHWSPTVSIENAVERTIRSCMK